MNNSSDDFLYDVKTIDIVNKFDNKNFSKMNELWYLVKLPILLIDLKICYQKKQNKIINSKINS